MGSFSGAPPRAIVREFVLFIRHPRLIEPIGLASAEGRRVWLTMTGLTIAVLALVMLPLLNLWQRTFSLSGPDAFQGVSQQWLAPIVIGIAPVIEEMLFRGWLTGRPRALWLVACLIGAAATLYAASRGFAPLPALALLGGLLIAAVAGGLMLRRRPAPPWFARAFPVLFALSVLAFGTAHVINYAHLSLLVLPMVLPQLWAGLTLGFVRMRVGLPASMLAHGCSNAAMLAAATLLH